MKHLTERQKQSIQTKLRITQISMELFKRNGFENVKIRDICNATGLSVGAFYHHFNSKDEIINTSYEQVDILVEERISDKKFRTHIDKVLSIFLIGCDILEELGWIFVSDVYKNLLDIDKKYTFNPNRFIITEIRKTICLAITSNELSEKVSADSLTELLLRTSRGVLFDWCLHNGNYNLKETLKKDLDLILNNYRN